MKRLPPKFVGGAFVALTSACSLVTSLDGLTGDPGSGSSDGSFDASTHDGATRDGGSTVDGGITNDDSGNPVGDPDGADGSIGDVDAADDGALIPPGDSGTPADASDASDGSTVTDTGTVGFCAGLSPKPLFCADYDEGSATSGWTTITGSGGAVSLSTAQSVSAPASMLVSTGSVSSTGTVDCAEYKAFASLASKAQTMTLAFDVRFDTVDSTKHDIVFGAIHLDAANGASYEVQLDAVLSTAGDLILDMPELGTPVSGAETYVDHSVSKRAATQQWIHMVMTATVPSGSGAGTAALAINGTQVLSTSINVLVTSWVPSAIVGITYVAPPSNPWGIRYDNVTFDSK